MRNDDRAKAYLKKRNEELEYSHKIKAFNEVYEMFLMINNNFNVLPEERLAQMNAKCVEMAKKVESRTKVSIKNTTKRNIKILEQTLRSLSTQYRIKFKERKEKIVEERQNMFEVVAMVEQQLGRSIPNINTMSVEHWLAYEKQAMRRASAVMKNKEKNKSLANVR